MLHDPGHLASQENPPRARPPTRSAERRGGAARFTVELARAQRLGPRVRPTGPSVRLLGPRAAPTTTLQGTFDARDDDPRTPDLAHSEHAFFGSESTSGERMWRGEPSALPTGVGCRVSGALGSECTSRSNLSPSFAHAEHPFVTAGRVSGLETPLASADGLAHRPAAARARTRVAAAESSGAFCRGSTFFRTGRATP